MDMIRGGTTESNVGSSAAPGRRRGMLRRGREPAEREGSFRETRERAQPALSPRGGRRMRLSGIETTRHLPSSSAGGRRDGPI